MYYVLRYGVRYLRKGHSLVLQSESTTQVALERESKRCLVFGVSIIIARKQLAAECNQQLVKRGVYGLLQDKLLRLFHSPLFSFLFTKM